MLSLSVVVLALNLVIEPTGRKENELLFPILFLFNTQILSKQNQKVMKYSVLLPQSFRWLDMKYFGKIEKPNQWSFILWLTTL